MIEHDFPQALRPVLCGTTASGTRVTHLVPVDARELVHVPPQASAGCELLTRLRDVRAALEAGQPLCADVPQGRDRERLSCRVLAAKHGPRRATLRIRVLARLPDPRTGAFSTGDATWHTVPHVYRELPT